MSDSEFLDQALRDRDGYFAEAARVKETLGELIPALEKASGLKATDFEGSHPGNELTRNEWVALWLARAILEGKSES